MAKADVVFHPDAAAELQEACAWYAERSAAVAGRFAREVAHGVRTIADHPLRWPQLDRIHRRLPLRCFPYLLIYREHDDRIWIVAVAHGHRRPGYWRERRPEPGY